MRPRSRPAALAPPRILDFACADALVAGSDASLVGGEAGSTGFVSVT